MKMLLFLVVGVLSLGLVGCEKKADLSQTKAKYSYAIGHQIGRNMKNQSIDLDPVAFQEAIVDQIKGNKSKMTDDEIRDALKMMAEARNESKKAEADENKKKGEAFLASNKSKEGIKTTDSGLQYKVINEGTGAKPKDSDTVKVHYRGTLIDGEEFDSSYKRDKPAEFPVKAVIPGWTEALQMMKVGAKYQLFIPSDLAYGSRGNPSIPGNSVLIFDVELLDIIKK